MLLIFWSGDITHKLIRRILVNKPGDFAETVAIVTTFFPQNVNDGNDNLFPQHFFLKHNSF